MNLTTPISGGQVGTLHIPRYLESSKKLENGITYWVMPNDRGSGKAHLSAVIKVGLHHEMPNQYQMSHFLEHLAFLGTDSFAAGEIKHYLESNGVKFGSDLNARTACDHTLYNFTIPTRDPMVVEKGIQMLYEMLFCMKIDPNEVEKERRVLLEEERQMLGINQRISRFVAEKLIGFQNRDARVIESYQAADLRAFYNHWYSHPELVGVVAVGDLDQDRVEEWIREYFGRVDPSSAPMENTPLLQAPKPPQFYLVQDKACMLPQVTIYRKMNLDMPPRDEVADTLSKIGLMLRMQRIETETNPLFPSIMLDLDCKPILGKFGIHQMHIFPKDGRVKEAFRLALDEIRKVQLYHLTSSEIETARSSLQQVGHVSIKLENPELSQYILTDFLHHPVWEAESSLRASVTILPTVSVEEVAKKVNQFVIGDDTLVLAVLPEGDQQVTVDELEAISAEVMRAAPQNESVARVEREPLSMTFPPPGRITSSKFYPEVQAREILLSNGIRVYLKQMSGDGTREGVKVFGFHERGNASYGRKRTLAEQIGGEALAQTGITRYRLLDLLHHLQRSSIELPKISLLGDKRVVIGSALPEDVETLMQLFHHKLSDRRYIDSQEFENGFISIRQMLETLIQQKNNCIEDRLREIETCGHPLSKALNLADFQEVTLEDARQACHAALCRPTSLKFGIVGPMSFEEMERMACRYLGSIPPSEPIVEEVPDLGLCFPSDPIRKTFHYGKEPGKAISYLIFPRYVGPDRKTHILDWLAVDIIEQRLIDVLRMEKRMVYTPQMKAGLDLAHPYGFRALRVKLVSSVQEVDAVVREAQEALSSLSGEALDGLIANWKENMSLNREKSHQSSTFWMGQIFSTIRFGWDLDREKDFFSLMDQITFNDVKEHLARQYLNRPEVVVTNLPENTETN